MSERNHYPRIVNSAKSKSRPLLVQPLEAASVVLASGPRIVDTHSPLRIPKLTSGATVGFIEEWFDP